ncbi:N-acetyl-gamma-glutamyl-phosphate reductase [Endomicrobiia bacterium]|uniref:N-acetyl-gamma-glutamyl-phosphate reductase n=1 Tax=Endomicrobium trichonymphae TaxID=1408204 RepID=UPI000864D019|nr:N-acetyl-gamma-glutamyl-phosphate reductase [Candidatus Endomicrobium trichonymphae]GHT05093.1 N-acetyl-gamma-glutamyl-phosphate reductase [Endomicrobiia bacterium]BAV59214.1 N-acetyl-gamma-glutamyl-phosphate reductase [Candidatus Endomicrobium trichonymphae]GHT07999.1 N-acetyl-gamma-glutamyl-phosphate reductase [Endomicrobiia bacterium]GHT14230.1 N-acetyl-gamma-glutamyl-phosphate reductase [Endomicrobiia bacterium]GHT14236.1 N-acetyl-gamma-glutamyl-phosphate reductase [Endomicrobiia bacter
MIRTGIVGITGYTGEELLRILSKHPNVKITGLYGRSSSEKRHLKDIYPHFNCLDLRVEALNVKQIANICDVVFLALPHAVAFEVVPHLIDAGVKVIDLSADFRLVRPEVYERWYNVKHTAKEYIGKSVYGLSELNTEKIKRALLIANPGCYPTTVILGCAPAVKNGFIDLRGIVIDSKSGISGSGRKSAQAYFKDEHPNFRAYKVAGEHRHIPEIEQELSVLSGEDVTISFTPHIMSVERGMLSTIYINMKKQIATSAIIEKYRKFYSGRHFIKILDENVILGIKDVLNTNYCEISMKVDERTNKLIIVSVIDNLVKGASGQAVQNMNIMFGLPETAGL